MRSTCPIGAWIDSLYHPPVHVSCYGREVDNVDKLYDHRHGNRCSAKRQVRTVVGVVLAAFAGCLIQPSVHAETTHNTPPSSKTESIAPHSAQKVRYEIRIDTKRPILNLYRNSSLYKTYPVALGKPATPTPIGNWKIVDKQRGWGGGFGTRWLGLNVPWGTYGIHGTNRPQLIGQYVSNGCIRMRNADVEQLYDTVPVGTPVIIHGNPVKSLRTLSLGNIGADVLVVQQRLHSAGFYSDTMDGKFSGEMQFALSLYQLAHHLPMDGTVSLDDYRSLGITSDKRASSAAAN